MPELPNCSSPGGGHKPQVMLRTKSRNKQQGGWRDTTLFGTFPLHPVPAPHSHATTLVCTVLHAGQVCLGVQVYEYPPITPRKIHGHTRKTHKQARNPAPFGMSDMNTQKQKPHLREVQLALTVNFEEKLSSIFIRGCTAH